MLHGKLALHGIPDVEQFCTHIIRTGALELTWHEHEYLLAYLVETCWELSEGYRPGGIRFSTYADRTLRLRQIDWVRKHRGRTRFAFSDHVYERPRVHLVPLDQLGHTEPAIQDDTQTDGLLDLLRVLGEGDSSTDRGDG